MSGITSHFRLVLPQSPVKQSILQPVINNGSLLLGASDTSALNLRGLHQDQALEEEDQDALAKPIMARADSTGGRENKAAAGKKSGKKSSGKNGRSPNNGSSSSMPFVRHHHSVKKPQTPSVSRRNARERNRVKQVNDGFLTLRTHIPNIKGKTSKVDTLRAAVEYIQALRHLVGDDGPMDISGPIFKAESYDDLKSMNDSGMSSPPRSGSSLSTGDINPMVYQLPPVSVSGFGLEPSRISSHSSHHSPKSDEVSPFDASCASTDTSAFLDGSVQWWTALSDPHAHQIPQSEAN